MDLNGVTLCLDFWGNERGSRDLSTPLQSKYLFGRICRKHMPGIS